MAEPEPASDIQEVVVTPIDSAKTDLVRALADLTGSTGAILQLPICEDSMRVRMPTTGEARARVRHKITALGLRIVEDTPAR